MAKIKTVLSVGWEKVRKKDPGKRVLRREAIARKRLARSDRQFNKLWQEGEESDFEEDEVITAPVSTRRGKTRGKDPGTAKALRSNSSSDRAKKGDDPSAALDKDLGNSEAEGSQGMGCERSERDVEGQPLRMRGSPSRAQRTSVEEEGEGSDDDEEWSDREEEGEFEDNLSYHEDSLSILRGVTATSLGKDIPVWVTTDTGSMTQLMQSSYADRLKFKRKRIPEGKGFTIKSPGGGRDEIEEYVVLPLRITCKRETLAEESYESCESIEEVRTIKMKFGLCENLPVPVLWGGKQMRKYDVLDYHTNKTLSLKLKGVRYIVPSTSWTAATLEMEEDTVGKIKKAYRPFIPSRERLTNMVLGGRQTINMPAILYPGRDNLVRVGRYNARVDEGYNEVLVNNREEFALTYGDWVVPIECVCNGEAFVIVRNNAEKAIRLTPGALKLSITPTVTLPRVLYPREVLGHKASAEGQGFSNDDDDPAPSLVSDEDESADPARMGDAANYSANLLKQDKSGLLSKWQRNLLAKSNSDTVTQEAEEPPEKSFYPSMAMATLAENETREEFLRHQQGPRRLLTWNCNGLTTRMKTADMQWRFYNMVLENQPDVISIQEVRLPREDGDPGRVKVGSVDAAMWEAFMAPLRKRYNAHLSLSSRKYGGQAVLVKKTLAAPIVTYNMGGQDGHFKSGRFIKLEFEDMIIRSVYAPFNGAGKIGHHERRQAWDASLKEELREPKGGGKARVLMGDLNVVYRDSDMSDHPEFWKKQGDQTVPEGDRGFGGQTDNERARFQEIVQDSGLSDTFTVPLDTDTQARWTFRGEARFAGKGMKPDYIFADDSLFLSGGVDSSEILCGTQSRDGFMGSDHAPLMCVLHDRWQKKRANLLAHYAAGDSDERRKAIGEIFANAVTASEEYQDETTAKGLSEARPVEFPEELWEYVRPDQRPLVWERYSRFTDGEYLAECLTDIMTKLDIQPREEFYTPSWFTPQEGQPALQEHFVRAQALANPHIYFHPRPGEIAMAKDVVAEVVTTNDKPFKCRPRKYAVVQQAFLHAKTNCMMRMGQLEETNSEWCHGLVLVAYDKRIHDFMAKHGDAAMTKMFEKEHEAEVATFFRLCVDLRMLNARTIPDRFPLPRIDDLLESVPRQCGRYSISDIADAFFKCELKKEDRHKTAFKTHDRHLQFAVLPQGFINSPSVFCRLIAKTFEGMRRERFSAYIDDVLNHCDDFKTHLDTQQEMYDRLSSAGLTLKLSKTHLNYERVKFLGHILTKEGRLPDPEAVEAIREWSNPTTTKEVRSFLGSTLYYREYIHGYSDMAMPLYDLIKKGVVVAKEWEEEKHGLACQRIKDALTSKPVLMQVDNTKPFRLKVDACRVGRGIGAILEQQNGEGKWQPVSYYSCSLSKEERNYSATELECKALHDSILHYAVYLKYIPHFEVFSDHNALRYMVSSDNATTNGRLMRYLLNLQEYNFAIYYRKGTENCDADAVSRLKRTSDQPVYWTEDELSKENGVVSKSLLERARALDKRNEKLEKAARKLQSKMARQELTEMSLLNDHILAEGVENLESESGRERFFKNLKALGLKCSRDYLDSTLDAMQGDKGRAPQADSGEAEDYHQPMIAAMVGMLADNRGLDPEPVTEREPLCMRVSSVAGDGEVMCGTCSTGLEDSSEEESSEEESLDGETHTEEWERESKLDRGLQNFSQTALSLLVDEIERGWVYEDWGRLDDSVHVKYPMSQEMPDYETLLATRDKVLNRRERLNGKVVLMNAKPHGRMLRKLKGVKHSYNEEDFFKVQPNWKHFNGKLMESPVNAKLHRLKKMGYGKMIVKESLIPGDTGYGLFARKPIKALEEFCSYEGEEVPLEYLKKGYGNKDYVIEAIRNHKTLERVCMDSPGEADCYGRYAQDPIDEDLVNAKILWREGRMVLVATVPITPGDEIYVHYGLDYWKERLHFLDEKSRARLMPRLLKKKKQGSTTKEKTVDFQGESTVAVFEEDEPPRALPEKIQEEGEPILPPGLAYRTRMERFEVVEGEKDPEQEKLELDQTLLDELAYENVDECEELADSLQFLVGRKFEDEGRMYEVYQVRYDPQYERIIGFRRPLSGKTPHKEDGSAFCVYGQEGLYELTERYLLLHPEERTTVEWPANNIEWARLQAEDPELSEIIKEIEDQGGGSIKRGRNKYALKDTDMLTAGLLVREVVDKRKGPMEQTMVPAVLIKSTLKMHHEGYGHMGSNRMLETIRLRYFWANMDRDIIDHAGRCLNCKLRKTYQRKPTVPIMKYDDTAHPLDRVHVDLTGPLPLTKGKHRYIMVIKDYLTKYVWLIPLKTKTAMEVAEAFVGEFICQAGVPGRLVSDRGNEFVNQLLDNISKVMKINRISTTPYNPRADGFVENHNKTLKDQLFHYVDNLKQDDWDVYLPTVQLMYNTTVSLATGYTPMLLMTGREARMPSLNHMASEDKELRKDVVKNAYVLKMIESMRGYQDFALSQTEKNKGRFNIRVRQPLEFVEYQVGQQFMRARRPISKFKSVDEEEAWKISAKLLERWEGPYRITKRINPVLYEAEIDGETVRVHAVNMKPF